MVLVLFRSVLETREKMIFYLLFNPDLLCHITLYCETISILHSYEIDRENKKSIFFDGYNHY